MREFINNDLKEYNKFKDLLDLREFYLNKFLA